MALASTCLHMVEGAPKMAAISVYVPRVSSSCFLPLEYSLRSAAVPDLGSFQITASALGLGAYEILCVHFKGGVSISHNTLALLKVKTHWPLKPNILGARLP